MREGIIGQKLPNTYEEQAPTVPISITNLVLPIVIASAMPELKCHNIEMLQVTRFATLPFGNVSVSF